MTSREVRGRPPRSRRAAAVGIALVGVLLAPLVLLGSLFGAGLEAFGPLTSRLFLVVGLAGVLVATLALVWAIHYTRGEASGRQFALTLGAAWACYGAWLLIEIVGN